MKAMPENQVPQIWGESVTQPGALKRREEHRLAMESGRSDGAGGWRCGDQNNKDMSESSESLSQVYFC